MKKQNLILLLLIVVSTKVIGQWTQLSNFPSVGRDAAICFQIGNKSYVGTGRNGSTLYNDFWEYDLNSGSWTQKANLGGAARFSAAEFVINDTAYVGLGSSGFPTYVWVKDFWMYVSSTNSWIQRNNFPGIGRYDVARFAINGKGYIGTGWNGSLYNDFWEYNPSNDLWIQKADFPGTSRQSTAYFTYGGKGYVGFGANGGSFYADMYEYDPGTDSWTQKSDYPGPGRNNTSQFVVGNLIYVGLGYNPGLGYLKDFWKYDPFTDSWTSVVPFTGPGRFHACTFVNDCKAYVITGYSGSYLNDFWELSLCAVPPVADFKSSDSVICALTCATFTDASSNATSWEWSFPGGIPSASSLQNPGDVCYLNEGSYDVTLIVSNAAGTDTLTITKYITVLQAPPTPLITQHGDSLICSFDTSYISYQWYLDGSIIPGATNSFYVHQQNGNYNLAVTNRNGCSIAVGIILGVEEKKPLFQVTPNPAGEEIILSLPENVMNMEARIFDLTGRTLMEALLNNRHQINISALAKGTYVISLNSGGRNWVTKFVKN